MGSKQGSLSAKDELKALEAELMLLEGMQSSRQLDPVSSALQPVSRDSLLPLSFAQQRLWFLDQLMPGNVAYNIFNGVRVSGPLVAATLRRCFDEIIRRHESLRTTFSPGMDQPVQVIAARLGLSLPIVEISRLCGEEQERHVQRLAAEEAQRPFDLVRGPLIRATLLRLNAEEQVLLLTMHHAISDGWSMGILIQELVILYEAFASGKPSPLPELRIQYADYAVWQRAWLQGDVLDEQVAYWRRQLAGAPGILELPTDRPRPPVQTLKGATESFTVSERVSIALQRLSLEAGTTPFTIVLAAFNTLLYRYTGQEDILVGSPIANRSRAEIEPLIGFFVNTLVLRADLSGDPTFRELVSRVGDATLGAYAHPELPFEILVEKLQPERDLSRSAFFQVMFVLNVPLALVNVPGLTLSVLEIENGRAQFDLTLFVTETQQGFIGRLEYNTALFDAATMVRLAGHYRSLLEDIGADPQRRISDLSLLTEAERRQLEVEWNATATPFPLEQCFPQLFEAQVEYTPDAVAVVFDRSTTTNQRPTTNDQPLDAARGRRPTTKERSPLHPFTPSPLQRLTYHELNRRANQLAHQLRTLGVGPEVVVALLAERDLDFLTSLLAVFKAGGAFVPLDPRHPAHRLRQVLHQSHSALVLCANDFVPAISGAVEHFPAAERPLVLRLSQALWSGGPTDNLPPRCTPRNLAYVIYTSGSTGIPKGAMIEQRGMVNHMCAKIHTLQLTAGDVIAQTAPQSFDISIWQFLTPLLVGGYARIFPDEVAFDPTRLLEEADNRQVTILQTVPSMMRAMLESAMQADQDACTRSSLRWLIPNGEVLPPDMARQWFSRYPRTALINAYGPTECSDDVTQYPFAEPPDQEVVRIPIGRPLDNMRLYVLDAQLRLVPVGVAGELHIGGVGVGRGYLREPAKTAQTFIPNPFAEGMGDGGWGMENASPSQPAPCATLVPHPPSPGTRLYKTGDLVYWRSDGNLEFLSRIDHQVKVRGFRIELGEIEVMLAQHPEVREAVVLAREDEPGEKRLVAYVVPKIEDRGLKIEDSGSDASERLSSILYPLSSELRGFLKERLPEYMLPSAFVMLEALPLTPNGKLDRRALPAPGPVRSQLEGEAVAPRTPVEEILASIWTEVLGVERVGVYANFFEVGGHSLLATQVISRVRAAFQVELPLRAVFEAPTIAALAGRIAEMRRMGQSLSAPPLQPAARDGDLPLSFAQQRLWFLDRLEPGSPFYNISMAMRLTGALDLAALQQSLDEVARRHEVLRTTFATIEGRAVQVIAPARNVPLSVADLSAWPAAEREAHARQLVAEEARQPFDLMHGPLLRAKLLRLGAEEHVVALTMHHIVSDGWSIGILTRELTTLWQSFSIGQPSPLPELPVQYADYAIWQRSWLQGSGVRGQGDKETRRQGDKETEDRRWRMEDGGSILHLPSSIFDSPSPIEAQLAYWRRQLAGAPALLELPTDRPRPAIKTYHGAYRSHIFPRALGDALRVLSRREGATLFMTLLAAFNALLYRYTGQQDIVIGSPIAGRNQPEIEGLIGFFVNTLVLRTNLAGNPTFHELVQRVREVALEAYAHQDVPFEMLVEALQPARDLSHDPLFQVMIALQNAPVAAPELPGLKFHPFDVEIQTAKFDLTLFVIEVEQELHGTIEYNTDLFDAATITRLLGHYQMLLEGISAAPQQRISDLPVLTTAEQRQLLLEWNSTQIEYPDNLCIHELFAAQAARTPAAVALVFDGQGPGVRGQGSGVSETRSQESGVRISDVQSPIPNLQSPIRGPQSSVLSPQSLTYRELNERANRLAHHLRALGVGPEARVGICMQRSLEMVVAIYGVLKAGGAYVPLDPTYPQERLAYMLADAQAAVLLTTTDHRPPTTDHRPPTTDHRPLVNDLRPFGSAQGRPQTNDVRPQSKIQNPKSKIVDLDADWPIIAQEPETDLASAVTSDNLAYIIYTSGSTGWPKGAMNTHGGLHNRILWMQDAYGLTPADRVLQKTPFSFDVSVWEFFWPLLFGAGLVVARPEGHKDSAYLARAIVEHNVTTVHFVPSMLRVFLEQRGVAACASLKRVICSGEALPFELQQRCFARLEAELHNLYGPTEAAVDVTFWRCDRESAQPVVPIGRPIANTQLYVLDAHLRPVPVGVPGELHIGGVQLARGYLGRPDLTAAAFIPNPFAQGMGNESSIPARPLRYACPPSPIPRLYRTGDLVRYRPDGNIEFLGRLDHQVKLRGFRIELGEVEALLRQHALVREAVVLAREDAPGEKRLVAYVVSKIEDRGLKIEDSNLGSSERLSSIFYPLSSELRNFLKEQLPDYMIPAAFVMLEALPLSPNGKLDRRALPAPEGMRPELNTGYISPRSEAERTIAAIWKDVLHVEQVGVDDNFFDLGGHSLLVAQVHSRLIAAFGNEFPLTDMFRYTTVASLAQRLSPIAEQAGELQPAGRSTAVPRRQTTEGHDIAIIGIVGRFPGADDLDQFWKNLRDGVESISFLSDEQLFEAGVDPELLSRPNYVKANMLLSDSDRFDARFFGISPREAEVMDPQQRLFLEYAWKALEHAGYDPGRYAERIGVYAGQTISLYLLNNLYPNQDRAGAPGTFQVLLSNNTDYLATQASYRLNLKGPAFSVQTACSTSLVAVHLACKGLIDAECDIALAGGVSLRVPQIAGYLYEQGGIASPDGHCRPFDAGAQGTVSGSGIGIVVLKRLARALEDGDTIHAVIKGSAINNDGARKIGYTAPSQDGQVEVIRDALEAAGVAPERIGYVEAHGTGTVLGDPIEAAALTQVFRASTDAKGFCGLGSVKSNIGHLDAAAGVAGLIKTVLALEHKQLPPSANFTAPNPKIDFANSPFYVNAELRDWETIAGEPRRAGVSSFGIGGTNAHVIVEEAPALPASDPGRSEHLLVWSARTEEALEQATADLAAYLRRHSEANLADVAYTLQVGRSAFVYRRSLVCTDVADAVAALEARDPQRILTAFEELRYRPLAFMFPGQGTQHAGMGYELYQTEPAFREVVDQCAELLAPHLRLDLRDLLYPDLKIEDRRWRIEDTESSILDPLSSILDLDQTWLAQPALFVVEYALARLWMEWGVRPQALIGHSIGEYVAACLAGVFSLEDALALVAQRGQLIQSLPQGSMLSVPLAESDLRTYLLPPSAGEGEGGLPLAIAAVNGPQLCTVAGPDAAIDDLQARLEAQGIECRRLHTSHAFHSTMMEPIMAEFAAAVGSVALHPPAIPFVSNVTGTWITADEATDPSYWARHLRQTVRFADGLRALLSEENQVLLEIGPGRTLSTFAKQQHAHATCTSLPHAQDTQADRRFLLASLGRLWLYGLEIDWRGFYAGERRRRIPLPTYPFARERYWIDPPARSTSASASPVLHKKSNMAEWLYVPSWRPSVVPAPGDEPTSWAIFDDSAALGAELTTRLRAKGHTVHLVRAGLEFAAFDDHTYAIDPREAPDYTQLLSALDPAPQRIAYCASEAFDVYGLLFLAQALGRHNLDGVRLDVITHAAQPVFDNEIVDPAHALLLGPALVIPQEYPDLACRSIDIAVPSLAWQVAPLYDNLLAELTAEPTDPVVAYRGTRRWVQTLQPIQPSAGAPDGLRAGGVYLITGGLGQIGRTLARHLAETVHARLVLTSRSGLPPRAEWTHRLAAQDPADPTSVRIRFVQDLEAQGAEVLVITADVADCEQMRAALAQTRQRFGTLNGVLHAAGIADTSIMIPIQEATRPAAETLLRPKVQGASTLAEVLHDQELDFCILFSSLTAVLGGLGFAIDAAANRFMDAFAQQHNQRQPTPWLSVNWDQWQFADAGVQSTGFGTSVAELTLSPEEGAQVFRQVLRLGGVSPVVVSTGDMQARFDQWVKRHASTTDAGDAVGLTARYIRPNLHDTYVAPRNQLEEEVAAVWQELLGIAKVGVYDNFFELGGHSLLAAQVMARVRGAFRVELPLRALVEAPTVAAMVAWVERVRSTLADLDAPSIRPVERDGSLPLSYGQERMWLLDQLDPDKAVFNISMAIYLTGPLDVQVLWRSFAEIVRRHETLRTTFAMQDGRLAQIVAPASPLPLPLADLRSLSLSEREAATQRLAGQQARQPFDLAHDRLARATLLRLDAAEHRLLLTTHHIVSDGWSFGVLIQELAALYDAFSNRYPSPLPALPIQYADFAVWQRQVLREEVLDARLAYWKKRLANLPPSFGPRPATRSMPAARHRFALSPRLSESLHALSRKQGVFLFVTLLTALKLVLVRYTRQDDVVVGVSSANRDWVETRELIGFFANMLVLRTDLSGHPSFEEAQRRVREVYLEAFEHRDLPIEKLLEAVQHEHIEVVFNFTPAATGPIKVAKLNDLAAHPIEIEVERMYQFANLVLIMLDGAEGLYGSLTYKTDLFDTDTIQQFADSYVETLEALASVKWVKRHAAVADAQDAVSPAAQHIRPNLQNSYVAPRNQIEKEVAGVWQQLLGIAEVGVYDNFFDLGGHSLLATQVISRIRNLFSVQLPIRRLLESPTVADLALAIAQEQLGEATDKDAQSLEALLSEVEQLSDDDLQRMLAESSSEGVAGP